MIESGGWITVRRIWSTNSLGKVTSGTAYFLVGISDDTEDLLYLQSNGTVGVTPYQFAMAVSGDEWIGKYQITNAIMNQQIHEIAVHSVYGSHTEHYILAEASSGEVLSDEPHAEFY